MITILAILAGGMLLLLLLMIYDESPEQQAKRKAAERTKIEADKKTLDKLARKHGADKFIESIQLCRGCCLDTVHNLMSYDDNKLIPARNIEYCYLRDHYETRSKAASTGIKDGIIAGVTGGGIIRDASTLSETYATGKVVVDIKFINLAHQYQTESIVFSDVVYAKKIKGIIETMSKA